VAWSWFRQSGVTSSRPPAGNADRWAAKENRPCTVELVCKMKSVGQMKPKKILNDFALVFFITTWLLMFATNAYSLFKKSREFTFGPLDIVRRVTAPGGKKTAILVRSYGSLIDLNFALYISDDNRVDVTDGVTKASFVTDAELSNMEDAAIWVKRALWISHDYEPTTSRNWHEDIVWSDDGAVIAVIIEDQYAFAYDFYTSQSHENPENIDEVLRLHSK
jgi:hypothetical protein